MYCDYCNGEWKAIAANRLLMHVSGVRMHGQTGVRMCTGTIPEDRRKQFVELANYKQDKRLDVIEKKIIIIILFLIIKKI